MAVSLQLGLADLVGAALAVLARVGAELTGGSGPGRMGPSDAEGEPLGMGLDIDP